MSTHTPGKWRVVDHLKAMDCIGIYAGNQLICELRDPEDDEDRERMLKNAPAIAAAPAMYEALKGFVAACSTSMNQNKFVEELVRLQAIGNEALRLAEGGKP